MVQDESIFQYEVTIKRVWAVKGTRPRVMVTGSKRKTCIYGALSDNGTQCYRQYETCNASSFLDYMRILLKTYRKLILYIDKAPWHLHARIVRQFVKDHKDRLRVIEFPVGFPESNPVEETWRQGKRDDRLGATFHKTFAEFKKATTTYYRTKRFNLNLYGYLCQ